MARWIERDKLGMMRCVVSGRSFRLPKFSRPKRPDKAPWVATQRDSGTRCMVVIRRLSLTSGVKKHAFYTSACLHHTFT